MESGALVDDDEFEFSFECSSLPASPVRADVVFYDWKMKQLFPMISSGGGEITEETEEENIINHEEDQNVNVNNVGSRREMKPLWELMKLEKEEFAFSSDAAAGGDYNNPPAGRGGKKGKSIWSCRPFLDLLRKGIEQRAWGVVSAAADVGRSI